MVLKQTQSQQPTTRRGHPHRVGQQFQIRQVLWTIFDYIEKTGNPGLYREIADTLEDELMARGLAGQNILEELIAGTNRVTRNDVHYGD